MDTLYNSVYNYKGECLGPYLNTKSPFRSTTSCGINRTLKVRNDTNCNIRILIKHGEFENLEEAKQKSMESIYTFDSGGIRFQRDGPLSAGEQSAWKLSEALFSCYEREEM